MADEREREIEARADFAGRNYSRLGSSWAEFYGRDIPYLLAQLREERVERDVAQETVVALSSVAQERDEARGKLEAVEPLLRRLRTAHEDRKGVCVTCCVPWPCMDAVGVDRILKERK